MVSEESKVLHDLYTKIKEQMLANPTMSIAEQRTLLEALHRPASEPTGVTYEEVNCPGSELPAIWCKPTKISASKGVILYLHGGGGFAGSPSSHRKLAGHLAKASDTYVLVTDYALVPERPFPEGLSDAVAAYKWLMESQGHESKGVGIAGDSAGGNLSTALVLKLKQEQMPLPAAVAVFSPWLDMECTGESLVFNAEKEALAPSAMLQFISKMYVGEQTSAKDPLANPLYGDYSGFPPLNISVGGFEALLSDSTRLAERAKMAGVDVTLEVSEGMQHVYHFMAGNAPEANETLNKVGAWFKGHLSG